MLTDIFLPELMGTATLILLGCGVVANVVLPKTGGNARPVAARAVPFSFRKQSSTGKPTPTDAPASVPRRIVLRSILVFISVPPLKKSR